jgi:pantetheine-phosphate adenylyltransferase
MVKAVFPGSFDPPTYGHLDIIRRGAALFDSLDVVIAVNLSKTPLFTPEERKHLLEAEISAMGLQKVSVITFQGLMIEYCRAVNAAVLLRGVRSSSDYSYEYELSLLNKQLNGDIETVLMPASPEYFVLRSSTIKEVLKFGGSISGMVPPAVEKALINRHGKED